MIHKDIETIIWKLIHNSNIKSLNIEYSQSVYKYCDRYPNETKCTYLCTHCTIYRNFEYNYRRGYYEFIHDLNCQQVARLSKNYKL